ncbi:MAG: response regulator transcription factor [Bacteroidetes bacterium]|nr:response regulator transcription factor [Bacteroidota bacterium]
MIRILIADDHHIVREGLKKILSLENDFEVVGQASTVEETMQLLQHFHPDVLILDISMPGRSGLDAIPDFLAHFPSTKVLVLSMHPVEMHAVRCIKAGAAGYLTKDAVPEELVTAVRRIHIGRRYINAALAEQLASQLTATSNALPLDTLSGREMEVLRLLAMGKKPAAIASDLGVSARTVGTYRQRILDKLELKSTAELIIFAIDQGLV